MPQVAYGGGHRVAPQWVLGEHVDVQEKPDTSPVANHGGPHNENREEDVQEGEERIAHRAGILQGDVRQPHRATPHVL